MIHKPVRTTPQADRQITELDAWWRANRDKAPDRFGEELALAFAMLSRSPGLGRRYPPRPAVRRILLRTTRNHVYYVERDDMVLVVAVWGAIKGVGPKLTGF
jgi:plasmid stabilization system protein ParE